MNTEMSMQYQRANIKDKRVLAEAWGKLTQYHIIFTRRDGSLQELTRETYDRGHGAVILLYNVVETV